jgi:ElaB/YqjD/DUF883 family membrane-anchored ribosome-binding protein
MFKNIEQTRDNIDALVDNTLGAADDIAGRAERGVQNAAERVVASTHTAGDYLRDKFATTASKLHQRLDDTANSIDRRYVKARTDLSRVSGAANGYVVENPRSAVLLAALGGFVFGYLAHRRLKSH